MRYNVLTMNEIDWKKHSFHIRIWIKNKQICQSYHYYGSGRYRQVVAAIDR